MRSMTSSRLQFNNILANHCICKEEGTLSSQKKDTDSIEDVLNQIGYTFYYIFHDLERSKVSDEMSVICVRSERLKRCFVKDNLRPYCITSQL
jgi:hypothetical protein